MRFEATESSSVMNSGESDNLTLSFGELELVLTSNWEFRMLVVEAMNEGLWL